MGGYIIMEENEPTAEPAVDESALLKPKPKREQTEKQKAVWAKAQQTRLDNAKAKRDALTKATEEKDKKREEKAAKHLAKKPKVVYESSSEEEPEVVLIKKKKKKAPVVVYESSSEEEAPPPPPKKKVVAVVAPSAKPVVRFF